MPATLATLATLATCMQNSPAAQSIALSLLVDLEAHWENLRACPPKTPGMTPTLKELHQKQRAYEAFFTRLVTYNKEFKPAHVPELLLNKASRLRLWCRRMRDLQIKVQFNTEAHYPMHVLEKAYRWADQLADRMKTDRIIRPNPSDNISAAIGELENLAHWCDNLCQENPEAGPCYGHTPMRSGPIGSAPSSLAG